MSGSNAIPPIKITVDGQQAAERALDDIARAAERMAARTQAGAAQMGTLATAADGTSRAIGLLQAGTSAASTGLGKLGGDFATLAPLVERAGTAATGLLGVLGRNGGLVGTLGAVGVAATAAYSIFQNWEGVTRALGTSFDFLTGRMRVNEEAVRSANGAVLSFIRLSEDAAERTRRLYRESMSGARDAAAAQRAVQEQGLAAAQTSLGGMNRGARQGTQNDATIAALEANPNRTYGEQVILDSLRRQAADLRAESQRAQQRLEQDPEYQRLQNAIRGYEARVAALRTVEAQAEARIAASVADGSGAFGAPPARPSGGGGGSRLPDPDLQEGWLAVQEQNRDREAAERREAAEWDREQERREKDEERRLERMQDRNLRTTDRIVDYGAERFAEMFDGNTRGFEGMLATFEQTAKSTLARIAAELILRPVIAPVVSALGLGQLGTGNGGFSGIGSLFGGGGGAVSTTTDGGANTGGGGLLSGLGQARSLFSAGGSGGSGGGFLGNIGGYLNNPIWQEGAGFFQPSVTAGQWAALGPGGYGPVAGGGSGYLSSLGGMSIGQAAAGVGAGFAAGSMVGRYTAGNSPARQQNSQIGAGVGAVAGLALTPFIGPLGPVVGGLAGGAIGGMIGPGRGFAGGDVGIGVGADGLLTTTFAGGKRFDSAEAQNQTRAQLDQLNAVLRAGGVTIGGMGTGTLGYQGFGESRNVFGPTEIFNRVRGNISSTNPTIEGTLRRGLIDSFDELGQVTDFITRIYEPLGKVRNYAEDFSKALTDQTSVYDQAIAKARELGLAEAGLIANRDRAIGETIADRDLTVGARAASLRAQELRFSGNPQDQVRAAMLENSFATRMGRVELRDFLRSNGFNDDGPVFANIMAQFDRVADLTRDRTRSDAQLAAGASGRSLMEDLTVGGLGGLAPNARYAAGLRVLNDARASGNLDRLTAAARSILPIARDYLGTSERFGALTADISRDVRRLGGDPVGLGVFLEGQAAGNQALERIYGLSNSQLTELKGMRQEIARLSAVITTLMQRR